MAEALEKLEAAVIDEMLRSRGVVWVIDGDVLRLRGRVRNVSPDERAHVQMHFSALEWLARGRLEEGAE